MEIKEGYYGCRILRIYLQTQGNQYSFYDFRIHGESARLTGVTSLRTFVTYSSVEGQCTRKSIPKITKGK